MRLTGTAFHCEVPEHWREGTTDGLVTAGSPFPVKGVAPRVRLCEFSIEERPDTLAAVSQATLRAVAGSPETVVIQVEAIVRHGIERRRIWMLDPAASEEDPEHAVTALTIRDLVIADGFLADLSLTMALAHWKPGDSHHAVLDSLSLLPPDERSAPAAPSFDAPELDAWATRRDGAPREDLTVVSPATLVLTNGSLNLSSLSARVFLNTLQVQADHVVTGELRRELAAAKLVDDSNGHPTATGLLCAEHVMNGTAWRLSATPGSAELRFWLTEETTLLLLPHPDQQGTSQLGFCSSDDLLRLLLRWLGTTPSWPLDVTLRMNRWRLGARIKQQHTSTSRRSNDNAEFLEQPWTAWSLTDRWARPQLDWLQSQTRGIAISHHDPSFRNLLRLTTIRQDPDRPFWVHLMEAIKEYSAPSEPQRR